MTQPSIGDSKKKGIAVTTIVALAAMKPSSRIELVIAGCMTLIAIVGIFAFTYLEKGEKNETEITNIDVPAND